MVYRAYSLLCAQGVTPGIALGDPGVQSQVGCMQGKYISGSPAPAQESEMFLIYHTYRTGVSALNLGQQVLVTYH